MATIDQKITDLYEHSIVATDDVMVIVDSPGASPVTKKVTVTNLFASHDLVHDGTNLSVDTTDDFLIDCGAGKTLELQAVVYDDIRINPGSFDRPGASDPTIATYIPGGSGTATYLYQFALNNIASFTVQLPHTYSGGDIKVHVHWTPGTRGNEESGNVVGWKVDYSWADINGTFSTMTTADLQDSCDGTDHKHQMTPDITITNAGQGISSMLLCNVKRTNAASEDTWVGTVSGQLPLMLEIDFHIPVDTMGSRQWTSK